MTRLLFALAVALMATACGVGIPAERHTVMLVRGQRYHIYCGGVVVGPRLIATAGHCVDQILPGEPVCYVTHKGYQWGWERHAAAVLATDLQRDIALLTPTQVFADWAQVRAVPVLAGEPVCSVYHPLGNPYRFECGMVFERWRPAPDLLQYYTTIPIAPGASGSGLWDREGRYCGTTVQYRRDTGWGIYLSTGPLRELMGLAGL